MIGLHASVIFIGYFAFFVAVVSGLLFLIQERKLKLKSPNLLTAPAIPLEVLDRINLWALAVGFLLFTAGTFQGLLLARTSWGAYLSGDPIEVGSLLIWLTYAGVLVLRVTRGFRGRPLVLLSAMSFLLVVLTFTGVHYVVGSRHVFF